MFNKVKALYILQINMWKSVLLKDLHQHSWLIRQSLQIFKLYKRVSIMIIKIVFSGYLQLYWSMWLRSDRCKALSQRSVVGAITSCCKSCLWKDLIFKKMILIFALRCHIFVPFYSHFNLISNFIILFTFYK